MRQDPPVGYNRDRFNDHPRVSVATSGAHKGRVYVTILTAQLLQLRLPPLRRVRRRLPGCAADSD